MFEFLGNVASRRPKSTSRVTRSGDLKSAVAVMTRGGGSPALSPLAWCLALVPDCTSAQWRQRWFIVGAFTRSLGGRLVTVSLWFCACIFRGFELVLSSMDMTVWPLLMLFSCWSHNFWCSFSSAKRTELGSLASGHGVGRGLCSSLLESLVLKSRVLVTLYTAARLVGGCVVHVLLAVHGVISSMSLISMVRVV
ncbi:hypothetical protein Bca101_005915 [Brassica carinata]